ncbi:hypothetical protein UMZ34_14560 [Halopseudomonas pachastrellae]|nr:hypothetical protein UMZ34_14560 [Halopseudomonas pachastrellae]
MNIDQLSWGADPIGAARFTLRPDATGAHLPELDVDLRGFAYQGQYGLARGTGAHGLRG